jgi:hypothetical protein
MEELSYLIQKILSICPIEFVAIHLRRKYCDARCGQVAANPRNAELVKLGRMWAPVDAEYLLPLAFSVTANLKQEYARSGFFTEKAFRDGEFN